jgi:hypothetical protein
MGVVKLSNRILRRSGNSDEGAGGEQEAEASPATPSGPDAPGAPGAPGAPASTEAAAGAGASGATVAEASAAEDEHAGESKCPHCGASMAEGQEWCTQCGERDNLMRKRAAWSSAGVLTIASAVLASGAAAAGVAALTQGSAHEPPHSSLIAQTPVTTSTTAAVPPAAGSPGAPETLKATSAAPAPPPATTATHSASSPSPQAGSSGGSSASSGGGTAQSQRTTTSSSSSTSEVPELQGLTASAYTLNAEYPKASLEGPENDPTRALEGRESGTSWTVQIKPGTAENVNVGLQIALGGPTRVGSVEMHTTTPGFPVEIYGTTNSTPPATLAEWKRLALTPSLKASATIKLGNTGTHWRYVLLWIPKVNQSTHHVSLGEVALYPPSG